MARFDHDIAIIGAGSAGLTAARLARFFRRSVVLIDRERLGGDCLHHGCVPSKALLRAARLAHDMAGAARWGLTPSDGAVDLGAVNDRVRHAVAEVGTLDGIAALTAAGVHVRLGGARFLDEHTLRVGATTLTARSVLIATGSRPAVPPVPGLVEAGYLTNNDVFDLTDLPPRLAVIGGGPVGVELAQAFARLGSRVTLVQRGTRLLPRDDADVVAVLADRLAEEGVDLRCGTAVRAVRRTGAGRVLDLDTGELCVDEILCATGRTPNIEDLGLDAAGVEIGPGGVVVDDRLRTTRPHIYAAGDVIGGPGFTHLAGRQASHAIRNIAVPGSARFSPGHLPWVTFTDPEIAHVGVTQDRAAGRHVDVVRFPFRRHERALIDGDPAGLVTILVGRRRRIVGASVAGTGAGEMINELTLAMNSGLTVDTVIRSMHAYPTYSLALPTALYEHGLHGRPGPSLRLGRLLTAFT